MVRWRFIISSNNLQLLRAEVLQETYYIEALHTHESEHVHMHLEAVHAQVYVAIWFLATWECKNIMRSAVSELKWRFSWEDKCGALCS